MKPAEAASLVRRWFDEHGRSVEMTLARYGVPTSADRADLKQEVFTTAFLALLRAEDIGKPRAWLNECGRKKASNYRRKESRRAPFASGEAVSTMASPARIAEDREALLLAFECLDEESQSIVLAVRADGLSWQAVADERGMTLDRAKYLYALAVTQMEAALKREDARSNTQRSVAFPVMLVQVFDALRAEVDSTPPELNRRVREGLERFMEATGAGAPDPESERVSVARPSPAPIQNTAPAAPSVPAAPALGILGGGVVIGIVIGYLFHGLAPDKPLMMPSNALSIPVLAVAEPAEKPSATVAPDPALSTGASGGRPVELLAQSGQGARRGSAEAPLRAAPTQGSRVLMDRARAAFQAGDAPEALALLAQHARSFQGKADELDRRELVQLVCMAPAVRRAEECADTRGGPASHAAR